MWTCSKCGEQITDKNFEVCWNCSNPRGGIEEVNVREIDVECDKVQPESSTLLNQLESAKAQRSVTAIVLVFNVILVFILLAMGSMNALFGVVAIFGISIGLARQSSNIVSLESRLEAEGMKAKSDD